MGLRGIGAVPLGRRKEQVDAIDETDLPWNKAGLSRADKVIAFCEALTVTSGKDSLKKLLLRPWQRKFVEAVYKTDRNGERMVRTAVLSMGRKNGKTQLAAALALCHLCGPEIESRGEIYSCANDRFQASKIYSEMVALIEHHDWLRSRCNIIRFKKSIEDLPSGSTYQALTKEAKTKFGLSPSFVVYDELGQTDGRELYDAMDSAMGARKEPMMLIISTQAADDFAPMSQLIDYGVKLNKGEIKDPSFHLTFYSSPAEDDPWKMATWKKANPALGDFRSLEDVERMALQAQRIPSQEPSFRNLILNQRVAAEARFMDQTAWRACAAEPLVPPGARIFAGLDLGATRDLTALVIVCENESGIYSVVPYCWVPGDLRARSDEDRLPYDSWFRSGHIMAAGVTMDPEVVARKIAEINGQNRIMALAFDRWRIGDLKREMDKIGCDVPIEPHGQGFKDMSPAVAVVERLVMSKKLRHGAHPVLTACANNAIVTRDPAGGRKFDKAKSSGRIDALVAMAMALNLALVRATKAIDLSTLIA